jgi:acetylornithine/succinyldiaminopimelate/putrescine aminotransferase/predicted amino acid dehydrogenase
MKSLAAQKLPTKSVGGSNFSGCFKPRLNGLLSTLGLDVSYHRGQGSYLYYYDSVREEVEVLDLVGGYGSLLLGHAHPVLVAEAHSVLASGRPMHAQASRREYAMRLAQELCRRAGGNYSVVFGNSGAEAVEAALKHAMLETGSRTFVVLEGGFHGKTLGALQLTANPEYRQGFGVRGLKVVRVPPNDIGKLENAFARLDRLAGFIFEPIQGEGGVRPLEAAFVQRAATLCAERKAPLIVDECQTGMGRTGTFLACEGLSVQPDYIVLSKALGGGVAKLSALLVRRDRYRDEFDLKHTSTYAEDDFSCAIALKALELLDDRLIQRCREQGRRLLEAMSELAAAYPSIIAQVRGRGLMVGIEFGPLQTSASFLVRFLSAQEDLGYLITGYLLNRWRVRVSPTLSDPFTIRLEPSASITDSEIQRLAEAMEDVCSRLRKGDSLGLTSFLTTPAAAREPCLDVRSDARFFAFEQRRFQIRQRKSPTIKVGWLCHLIDADNLVALEPAFAALTSAAKENFLSRMVPRLAPTVMSAVDIHSRTGDTARVYPILLPLTSRWMKGMLEAGTVGVPRALVQHGVDRARSLNCQLVALGQYTSIVTLAGTKVQARGMGVTTGNSYAVALAVQAIERAEQERGLNPGDCTLAIVGAGGNIGRTCADLLASRYRKVILIGTSKPGSVERLNSFARTLPNAFPETDLRAVSEAEVVVLALNAVDEPILVENLVRSAIVCDLSVPASLSRAGAAERPDVLLIKGGIASLPFSEDLEIPGFPLPRGQAYGCLAEAVLLGFEGCRDSTFTGSLTPQHVWAVGRMAHRHGFRLADFKYSCTAGSTPPIVAYASVG